MLVQRVSSARVETVDGLAGEIGPGLLVFLGIGAMDEEGDIRWLVSRLARLRVFEDSAGKMNLSLRETGGDILLISQFTLFGSLKKGSRPSFNRAAPPDKARPMFEHFHHLLQIELGKPVPTGVFGAMMTITAVNDGPVSLIVDSRDCQT